MRELKGVPQRLSYILSSLGYDLRLSTREHKVFRHISSTIVDPKRFQPRNLEKKCRSKAMSTAATSS